MFFHVHSPIGFRLFAVSYTGAMQSGNRSQDKIFLCDFQYLCAAELGYSLFAAFSSAKQVSRLRQIVLTRTILLRSK